MLAWRARHGRTEVQACSVTRLGSCGSTTSAYCGEGQVRRGTALEGRSAGRLEWAVRSYLVKGSRARRFRQAGGSRQTEADGVLGGSRGCKCWCVKGRMVGVAWTEHGFFVVVEGRW